MLVFRRHGTPQVDLLGRNIHQATRFADFFLAIFLCPLAVVFLALAFAACSAFSAAMRLSKTEAGSSLGSWSNNWPEKAFFRMDWRRASDLFRLISRSASICSTTASV